MTEAVRAAGGGGLAVAASGQILQRYSYDPLDRTSTRTDNAGGAGEKTTTFDYLGLSGDVVNETVRG